MYFSVLLMLMLCCICVTPINHWVLKDDGRIMQKIDSPFYMREPDNLVSFLEQIKYNEYVEMSYLQLLRQREQIVEHIKFSVEFGENLVGQAKCAMDYYLMEQRMSYLIMTPAYLKRLTLADVKVAHALQEPKEMIEPVCEEVAQLSTGPCCYDHLESFQSLVMKNLHIEREEEIYLGELAKTADDVRRLAVNGLLQHPQTWLYHTISSYYWRWSGHAQNALACARLAVMQAPRAYKDIPLLSLGTILFRAGRLQDADVILTAAVEHAPHIYENHIALASALAMKHDFNRSLQHFDEAELLNPSLLSRTLSMRNFISCLDNLTKKSAKMYSYVEYMKNEVNEFKRLKQQISQNHEKLTKQQVPLSARVLDTQTNDNDLLKRGQYCSTRTLTDSEETVLFCDFYSDIQMRLESTDVDIESLERDLRSTSEAVIRQVSTEMRKQLNFEQMVAQVPASATTTNTPTEINDEKNAGK